MSQRIAELEKSETERKRAEEALKESEEILQVLVNATRETLLLIDTEGTVLLANEVVAQRLGKSVQELIGTSLYDHFLPDVAQSRKKQFDKVAITGEPVHFEDTREGRFFGIYCYPVFNKEGKVSRVAIFAHEITEQKQAEKKLLESEERHRILSEKSSVGMYLIQDNLFRYVNQAFAQIFGYTREEIVDRLGPMDFIVPEDRKWVAESTNND